MIELYYTLLMLCICIGMYFYSKSIPVVLFSLYSASWFFPQGITLYFLNIELNPLIGFFEFIFVLSNIKVIIGTTNTLKIPITTLLIYIICILSLYLIVACFSTKVEFYTQLLSIKSIILIFLNIFMVLFFKQESDFKKYIKFIIFLTFFSGIYSIYTYIIGSNPVGDIVAHYIKKFESQGLGGNYINTHRGFLKGRIMGFTVHPLMFGGVVALFSMLILQQRLIVSNVKEKTFCLLYLFFLLILILLTGSRSVIIGVLFGMLYLFSQYYHKKFFGAMIISFLFIVVGNITIDDVFLKSIIYFWNEDSDVSGSSYGMRTIQLEACLDEIDKDITSWLFGLGHEWSNHYLSINGNRPPFQGFESILFVKIVNTGLLGTVLYFIFVYYPIVKLVNKYVYDKLERKFIISFMICGLTISLMTGDYYGYRLYLVLIFFFLKYYLIRYSKRISIQL